MLVDYTTAEVYTLLLIFCRIGSGIMVLPGIGEGYVNSQSRLMLALMVSLILAPLAAPLMPAKPENIWGLFLLMLGEITIGIFIGCIARLLISVIHTAGMVIATQSGLASAMLFDVNAGTQGAVVGNFLSLIAVTLLFVTDMHHLLLYALTDSYTLFKPGIMPPMDDFSRFSTQIINDGFMVAIKLSAPLLVIGTILFLGAGVLARLMPQIQIFFILMPVQIMLAFVILFATLSGIMMWYMEYIDNQVAQFIVPR